MAYSEPNACQQNCSHDELTSSGYESELFLEPNKTIDFLCVICQLVAKRPKTHYHIPDSAACQVIFCADCLKNYVRHHNNSLSTSQTHQDAFCPFRCGVNLILRGRDRNIIPIPRRSFNKLNSLKMLCPFGRGIIRYINFEEHCRLNQCDCQGFTPYERRTLEKRVDSMLNQVCSERYQNDELFLVRNFARIILDSLNPE